MPVTKDPEKLAYQSNWSPKANKRTLAQREKDLTDLADLYLMGNFTLEKMAEFIAKNRPYTIGLAQISHDLVEIRRRWQEKYLTTMDEAKSRELAHLDKLEMAYWDGWLRSINDANKEISEIIEDSSKYDIPITGPESRLRPPVPLPTHTRKKAKKLTEKRDGDPKFLEGIKWCIDERCKIMGLHAPTELSIKDWRKEAQRAGIPNASEIFNDLVKNIVASADQDAPLDGENGRGSGGDSEPDFSE